MNRPAAHKLDVYIYQRLQGVKPYDPPGTVGEDRAGEMKCDCNTVIYR